MVEICVTIFSVFGAWGANPGPKFTKRGDDLADSEIYHPAKYYRPMPTHARYIRYQSSCGQTNKQTVNDISTTCLSAIVDKKDTNRKQLGKANSVLTLHSDVRCYRECFGNVELSDLKTDFAHHCCC